MGGLPNGENSSLFIHRLTEREAMARDGKKRDDDVPTSVTVSALVAAGSSEIWISVKHPETVLFVTGLSSINSINKVEFTELVVDTSLTTM